MKLRLSAKDEARFWSKVDASGDCWIWTGSRMRYGHGRFYVQGRDTLAHRVIWELLIGPIPEGFHIDHRCVNPPCVNPDHLEPVTLVENVRRAKGLLIRKAAQTHCIRGHLFDQANTYIDKRRGSRMCRQCHADYARTRRAS